MGNVLNRKVRSGDFPARVPASFFNSVDEILTRLQVYGGHIEKNGNNWTIVFDRADGAVFSGIVWVGGTRYNLQGTAAKEWVKVDVENETVAYDATGPASEGQFEDGVEWFRTAYAHGDIHVTRF